MYIDEATKECLDACPDDKIANGNNCILCEDPTPFKDIANSICVGREDCPAGTYGDSSLAKCADCHGDCATCDGKNNFNCLSCSGDRYLLAITCGLTCPEGMLYFKLKVATQTPLIINVPSAIKLARFVVRNFRLNALGVL